MSWQERHRRSEMRSISKIIAYVGFILGLTGVASLTMEAPIPVNPLRHGAFLSVLWCGALMSWLLGFVRSHESRFGMKTMLVVVSAAAVGFANVAGTMCVMGAVCLAMILDVGVVRLEFNRNLLRRALQGFAGFTGLAHAIRVLVSTYHGGSRFAEQHLFFLPGQLTLTPPGQLFSYSISTLLAISLAVWLLGRRTQRLEEATKCDSA